MAFTSDNVQVFLAVLDQGSFSAAARALGRVPSAVSMAVANLEAELDLQLFDRTGREPRPTDAARALEPQVRLAKLDTEAHPQVAAPYNIRSIPTMVLFKGGREVARISGALGAADIERWVRAAL